MESHALDGSNTVTVMVGGTITVDAVVWISHDLTIRSGLAENAVISGSSLDPITARIERSSFLDNFGQNGSGDGVVGCDRGAADGYSSLAIFADGFETGSTGRWSATAG